MCGGGFGRWSLPGPTRIKTPLSSGPVLRLVWGTCCFQEQLVPRERGVRANDRGTPSCQFLCIFLCKTFPRPSLWGESEWVTDSSGGNLGIGQDWNSARGFVQSPGCEAAASLAPGGRARRGGSSAVTAHASSARPAGLAPASLGLWGGLPGGARAAVPVLWLPLRSEHVSQSEDAAALASQRLDTGMISFRVLQKR